MKLNFKKSMILFVSILGLSGCESLNAYYQDISSRSPLARFNSYRLYQFAGSTYAAYDNDSRVSYDFNQTVIQEYGSAKHHAFDEFRNKGWRAFFNRIPNVALLSDERLKHIINFTENCYEDRCRTIHKTMQFAYFCNHRLNDELVRIEQHYGRRNAAESTAIKQVLRNQCNEFRNPNSPLNNAKFMIELFEVYMDNYQEMNMVRLRG